MPETQSLPSGGPDVCAPARCRSAVKLRTHAVAVPPWWVGVLALSMTVALLGCAGQSGGASERGASAGGAQADARGGAPESVPGAEAGQSGRATDAVVSAGTSAEPHKGSLPIRITILQSWPGQPALGLAPDASSAAAAAETAAAATDTAAGASSRVVDADQFAALLRGADQQGAHAVVSRPRLEVIPGLEASIAVGTRDAAGTLQDGYELQSTVTLVEIPADWGAKHRYTMDIGVHRAVDGHSGTPVQWRGVQIAQGSTVLLLAPGPAGTPPMLVCVTPGPELVTTQFTPADRTATAQAQQPLINFVATLHRVDAPRDYGSPKGDAPLRQWSAAPGGTVMNAAEFTAYLAGLRARAGYQLLARPAVWALPSQEFAIEVMPELDAPTAVQRITGRGTIDPTGAAVECTGSYTRTERGMSTEGHWARPLRIEPGGAVIWSIHDPRLGAWFTLTLQAWAQIPDERPAPQSAGPMTP